MFYAVSAIFQPYNGGNLCFINDQFGKFLSIPRPDGPHEPTLLLNPVKRSFTNQWGCYPRHGAPFNVPTDGHRNEINVKTIK